MLLLWVLLAGFHAPGQPSTDAEVWTAAVTQLCEVGPPQRGECVIIAETLPSQGIRNLPPSTQKSARESALVKSLVQRNSAPGVIRNPQLPPGTPLVPLDSITTSSAKGTLYDVNWESFAKEYPHGVVLRLSLPAFSEDGTNAIVYYTETSGFDDSRGGYLIFEKKQGGWVLVNLLGYWIT